MSISIQTPSAVPAPFLFDGRPVRVVDRSGDPWFVAADAIRELGYGPTRITEVLDRLDDDEKGYAQIVTLGGPQNLSVISEPGLYKTIARSTKPDAKRFDRWVRHDVLPTIRKTGGYSSPALPDFSDPVIAARAWADAMEQKRGAEQRITLMAPKVDAFDRISEADGTFTVSEAAKALQMQIKELFAWLRANHWIYRRRGSKRDLGYADKVAAGYLTHKVDVVKQDDGTEELKERVRVTPKGIAKLAALFTEAA